MKVDELAFYLTFHYNQKIVALILEKQHNHISGEAYQCKQETVLGVFKSDFFSFKDEALYFYSSDEISETKCWEMLINKKCNWNEMRCEELLGCSLDYTPDEENRWWSTQLY